MRYMLLFQARSHVRSSVTYNEPCCTCVAVRGNKLCRNQVKEVTSDAKVGEGSTNQQRRVCRVRKNALSPQTLRLQMSCSSRPLPLGVVLLSHLLILAL
jgi:hypothetical protein